MLRATAQRHFLGGNRAGGAGASWFGKSQLTDTLWGCASSLFVCVGGIAIINIFVRGNPMGHAATESDLYLPDLFRRRTLPEPESHGFVGNDLDKEPPSSRHQ